MIPKWATVTRYRVAFANRVVWAVQVSQWGVLLDELGYDNWALVDLASRCWSLVFVPGPQTATEPGGYHPILPPMFRRLLDKGVPKEGVVFFRNPRPGEVGIEVFAASYTRASMSEFRRAAWMALLSTVDYDLLYSQLVAACRKVAKELLW